MSQGRPTSEPKGNSIRIRLSEDMRKSLDEIASGRQLSLSELGREAFEAMIRDNRHK